MVIISVELAISSRQRRWLVAGLLHYPFSEQNSGLRGYRFELVCVLIALGRWREAKTLLIRIDERAMLLNAN